MSGESIPLRRSESRLRAAPGATVRLVLLCLGAVALPALTSCGSGGGGGKKNAQAGIEAPTARFSASATLGTPPFQVAFVDESIGDVESWSWDFGDGASSTERNPVHTYDQPGLHTVTLTVGGSGGTDVETKVDLIDVKAAGTPIADFDAAPRFGAAPLEVELTNLSRGEVTRWGWDFGDGETSEAESPIHVYRAPGTYTLSLEVEGPGGSSKMVKARFVNAFDPQQKGIWTTPLELQPLPMSGEEWESLLAAADSPAGKPDLSDLNDNADAFVLAKALVHARTGEERYRDEVIAACLDAIGTEVGGSTLPLARNLIGYIIAADLVKLPAREEALFRAWLRRCLTETLQGRTLASTHEDRPNNWGMHAGASRAAIAVYLDDARELERSAQVFRGFLGDRGAYAGFDYGSLSWQADPTAPVGINPRGATKDGHSIDGVVPDDQRRGGGFRWPPHRASYVWEGLQGAFAQAVVLYRAGHVDVWDWEDQALLRAVQWLHEQCNFPARGDDAWVPHVVNHYYGTSFPAPVPSGHGKNVGWTDWTHAAP